VVFLYKARQYHACFFAWLIVTEFGDNGQLRRAHDRADYLFSLKRFFLD
jgi:hypothetical protein